MSEITAHSGADPNSRQVGGEHYRRTGMQHWDLMVALRAPYLVGCLTKYVERHGEKGGRQDLDKAIHYAEKRHEEVRGSPDSRNMAQEAQERLPSAGWATLADYAECAGLSPLQTMIFETALLRYGDTPRLVELCHRYRIVAYPGDALDVELASALGSELSPSMPSTQPKMPRIDARGAKK